MRVIVAGSRSIHLEDETVYFIAQNGHIQARNAYQIVEDAILRSKFDVTTVVSGTAQGVDRMGELWALNNGIPLVFYPPNWREHGKKAGFIRNAAMADNADALVAVWDGESPGTEMMIDIARKKGLLVYVDQVETVK